MSKVKLIYITKIIFILFIGILIGSISSIVILKLKNKNEFDMENIFGMPLIEVDGKVWCSTSLPKESIFEYYNLENNIYNAKKSFVSQVALRIAHC